MHHRHDADCAITTPATTTFLDLHTDAVLAALNGGVGGTDCALVLEGVAAAATKAAAPRRHWRPCAPHAPRARRAAPARPPTARPPAAATTIAPSRSREEAIAIYRAKRAKRLSLRALPILYVRRKANADSRPRVGGRFVSREIAAALKAAELE